MAEWLNTTFHGFDSAVFTAMGNINCGFLNFFCKAFSLFGEKGIPLILTALVLMCFSKTRKVGFTMLVAIAVGALFTNIVLKNAVGRARPFAQSEYYNYLWQQAGAVAEGEFSFPSGHATATTAFVVALFLACDKKWSYVGLPFALLMAFCRVYLVVHFTTDVIAGLIVGTVAGVIAFYLVKLFYKWLDKKPQSKLTNLVYNASVVKLFAKEKNTDSDKAE